MKIFSKFCYQINFNFAIKQHYLNNFFGTASDYIFVFLLVFIILLTLFRLTQASTSCFLSNLPPK